MQVLGMYGLEPCEDELHISQTAVGDGTLPEGLKTEIQQAWQTACVPC